MESITRFYWVVGDLYDGGEYEQTFRQHDQAKAAYDALKSPYKKLVAHVADYYGGADDKVLESYKDEAFWAFLNEEV